MAGTKKTPDELKESKVVILTTKKQEADFREKCAALGVTASEVGRELFAEFLARK